MMRAPDQILAAIEAQLASVAGSNGVHRKPLFLLDAADLDCIVIDDITDELVADVGYFPRTETHTLSFDVIPLVMATAETCLAQLGDLHLAVEQALFGSLTAIRLGGLLNRPLKNPSTAFFSDTETLQQPVCGWRLRVSCTYHTRSDQPGLIDKES